MNFFYQDLSVFFEYLHSIRKIEDYISIDLKFPLRWGIPKSIADDGHLVPFNTGEEETKGYSFVSAMTEKDIQDTLGKITKTIKMNKDKEIKETLFKQTVDKLKITFEKNNLEKLEKLYFDFEPEEPKLEMNENGEIPVDTDLA